MKFIRWAQWRIDRKGEGVIGYIVNNSFLDGPTFRGMRQSLLASFNTIYLLNLHGSSRITEVVPEAVRDENVFDISQGVCILLCVKESDNPAPAKVRYTDIWGSREEKYKVLSETEVESTEWRELQPMSPYYLLVPQATELISEYELGWKTTDVFQTDSVGIVTGRDKFTLHWTAEKLREVVDDFVSLSEDDARKKYQLPKNSQDWKIHLAQADLRNHPDADQHVTSIHYRPFDTRWTYYTGQSSGFHGRPRPKIMRHMRRENLALCIHRGIKSPVWQHVLVTDQVSEKSYISNRGEPTAHVFPLYLYPRSRGIGDLNRTIAQFQT